MPAYFDSLDMQIGVFSEVISSIAVFVKISLKYFFDIMKIKYIENVSFSIVHFTCNTS